MFSHFSHLFNILNYEILSSNILNFNHHKMNYSSSHLSPSSNSSDSNVINQSTKSIDVYQREAKQIKQAKPIKNEKSGNKLKMKDKGLKKMKDKKMKDKKNEEKEKEKKEREAIRLEKRLKLEEKLRKKEEKKLELERNQRQFKSFFRPVNKNEHLIELKKYDRNKPVTNFKVSKLAFSISEFDKQINKQSLQSDYLPVKRRIVKKSKSENLIRYKLLQFSENLRPPYFGNFNF